MRWSTRLDVLRFLSRCYREKNILFAGLLGALGVYVLISVKVYILLSFLPPALLWVFNENNQRIRSAAVRMLLKPFS